MAHIICITSGLNGILNASFELVNRIKSAGHECTYASPRDVEKMVAAQGVQYVQLSTTMFDPAPELPEFSGVFRKFKRWGFKLYHIKGRRAQAVENLGMASFNRLIHDLKPDLIIIDVELHEHIMTLMQHKHNVVLLSQWFSLWNRRGLPPLSSNIIPNQGFWGSLFGMRVKWFTIRIQRWWIFLRKKFISVYTDRRSILQKYAKEIGFPDKYIKDNYWPGPFTYSVLPVLSMTPQELEFPHDFRDHLHYIGPLVSENRRDIFCTDEIKDSINTALLSAEEKGQKVIYCSVSTFKAGDMAFLKKVIAAIQKRQEWMLILGLGGRLSKSEIQNTADNIYIFDYVPQLAVLKNADLSINHGGIHTINECIHFGVPMLVYSGQKSDQNGCASRVKYFGVGLTGDKDSDSISDIEDKIQLTLNSDVIKDKVRNIYTNESRERDKGKLNGLIDQYLKRKMA